MFDIFKQLFKSLNKNVGLLIVTCKKDSINLFWIFFISNHLHTFRLSESHFLRYQLIMEQRKVPRFVVVLFCLILLFLSKRFGIIDLSDENVILLRTALSILIWQFLAKKRSKHNLNEFLLRKITMNVAYCSFFKRAIKKSNKMF